MRDLLYQNWSNNLGAGQLRQHRNRQGNQQYQQKLLKTRLDSFRTHTLSPLRIALKNGPLRTQRKIARSRVAMQRQAGGIVPVED